MVKRMVKKNNGFTLVELIVVLVILAILAAVLVPGLMGYIDKAKEKKYIYNAKACLDAAQAELTQLYGKNGPAADGVPVISGAHVQSTSGNEDQDISKTDFAKNVLSLAGKDSDPPYCFIVGVGSNVSKGSLSYKVTDHDKYTVYYAFYMEKKDDEASALYFYNGEWTKKNPRWTGSTEGNEIFDKNNIVKSGPLKGKRIQYYVISNKTKWKNSIKDKDFWTWLKDMK